MSTDPTLEAALDGLAIAPAAGEHQIQARDGDASPPASSSGKHSRKGELVFFEHVSQDVSKFRGEEVTPSNYVVKDVKRPKIYTCVRCNVLCSPKKCAKCQKIVYCSTECQRADWPSHKPTCKALAEAFAPSDLVLEKAVLKLSMRMMGDQDFVEQLFAIVCVVMDLYHHPERSRTHFVAVFWDLVPLRTAHEYRQNLPAKERVDDRGKQRYMLKLVHVQSQPLAKSPPADRSMIATRRGMYLEQNRARLRSQGVPEDSMDDENFYHIPLFYHYSKTAHLGGNCEVLFTTMYRGVVCFKYAAVLGDIQKLMAESNKAVSENDWVQYAIRLLNSRIVTSQSGRNYRTSISLDETEDDN